MLINRVNIYLLSFFPLIFFIAHLFYRANQGRLAEILWLCHISNLILFIALLLNNARLTRVASLWLIIGFCCWIVDLIVFKDFSITSTIAHIGGLTVALLAISQIQMAKYSWVDALIFGLLIQLISRFFTAPQFNVNVAHKIYPGIDKFFFIYWQYWLFNTIFMAICLYFINFILSKIIPEN